MQLIEDMLAVSHTEGMIKKEQKEDGVFETTTMALTVIESSTLYTFLSGQGLP